MKKKNGAVAAVAADVAEVSSLLNRLDEESKKRTKPDAKEGKALRTAWEAATATRERAQAALDKAEAGQSEAAAALIRAYGKGRLKFDDTVYIPMSRGEKAFLRREGALGEVTSL